jgi:hypothetical protein
MKINWKFFLSFSVLILFLTCLPSLVHAQGDPGCDPLDPLCPIDGGLGFLLAAGVGYGIKKVHNKKIPAPGV